MATRSNASLAQSEPIERAEYLARNGGSSSLVGETEKCINLIMRGFVLSGKLSANQDAASAAATRG